MAGRGEHAVLNLLDSFRDLVDDREVTVDDSVQEGINRECDAVLDSVGVLSPAIHSLGDLGRFAVVDRHQVVVADEDIDLVAPSLNLSMVEAPRTGVNASHFGFQVAGTADVLEARLRFESAGLRTFSEQNTTCCYALQDKVWIEDPDGNSWEVFVVKADAATMHRDPVQTGCCAPTAGPVQIGTAPVKCC